MKTKIVIGSLFAVFMLMMLPSVSAMESNTVVEANKSQLLEKIQNMDTEKLTEKFKVGWYPIILVTLVHSILYIIEETILPGVLLMPLAFILAMIIHLGGICRNI